MKVPQLAKKTSPLHLGYIDDVDEVYFNGVRSAHREISLLTIKQLTTISNLLSPFFVSQFYFKNVVAVRVYDAQLEGGIMSGDPGIFENETYISPDFELEEPEIMTGDSAAYINDDIADSAWKDVIVPSYLENQGFFRV
ncbi:MAG: hypothetical protein IPG53_06590 [Ignavibacteriales bacterium]|nr:hypothetical protein [Ignavibacteriales bacterium]